MRSVKVLKFFSVFLFVLFLFIYIAGSNGFYEYKLNEKKVLTEEQIKKFENDINNGNKIDINDYVVSDKNYDNTFTKVSRDISKYISKGFEETFKYLFRYIDSNI